MKAAVHEEKLAEFQRDDMHMHVHAEEPFVETGYNPTRVFLLVFFFSFPSLPPSPGEEETTKPKLCKCSFFCMHFTYAKTMPHNKLEIVGQVNFLLLIFLR